MKRDDDGLYRRLDFLQEQQDTFENFMLFLLLLFGVLLFITLSLLDHIKTNGV